MTVSRRTFVAGASAVAALAVTGCAQSTTPAPKAAAPDWGGDVGRVTAVGPLKGVNDHVTKGYASVSWKGGKWMVNLSADFFQDDAPDLYVALGNGGYRSEARIAKLGSKTGAQSYVIPSSLDVADYNQVWIWCEKFSVEIGMADLKLT